MLTHGKGYISFESKDEKTYLKDLYQKNPVKILFPKKLSNEINTAAFVTTSGGIVGGDKEYNEMLQWATQNLNPQEVQMFDAVMDRGDPLAAFFAIRSLSYRYQDSQGRDGRMVTGTAPRGDGSQFQSQAEVVEAMSDPRYDRDPAFRQKIMKKLERSDINF